MQYSTKNKPTVKSLTNLALNYYDQGLTPIPIQQGEKHPPKGFSWKKYQSERPPRKFIKKWDFENIGLICGKVSDLAVIDIDSFEGYGWFWNQFNRHPEARLNTPIVQSGSGTGLHVYYKYPNFDISEAGDLREDVELKRDKQLVIAPPSQHPSGSKYKWVDSLDTDIKPMPEWLKGKIKSGLSNPGKGKRTAKNYTSVSSKPTEKTKSSEKPKKTVNVDKLIAPRFKGDLDQYHELLEDPVFEGKAKSGSRNGRFVTALITGFNLDVPRRQAVKETARKYPEVDINLIKESAKGVYEKEYGLGVQKMVRELGINKTEALNFLHRVTDITGWRTHQSEGMYQGAKEFNKQIFTTSLAFTLTRNFNTTYGAFAKRAGISSSTLAQKEASELPNFVSIKAENGKGVKVFNSFPIFVWILAELAKAYYRHILLKHHTFTNTLCCYGVVVRQFISSKGLTTNTESLNNTNLENNNKSPPN